MENLLRNRFLTLSGATVLLLLLNVGVAFWGVLSLTNALEESNNVASALKNHMEGDMMHDAIRADMLLALKAASENDVAIAQQNKQAFAEHKEEFRKNIKLNQNLELSPEIKEALSSTEASVEAYITEAEKVISLSEQSAADAAKEFPTFMTTFSALEDEMEKVGNLVESLGQAQATQIASMESVIILTLSISALLGIALVLSMPYLVIQWVFNPLAQIINGMSRLSKNDTHLERLENAQGEISIMSDAMEKLQSAVAHNILMQKMTEDYPVLQCNKNFEIVYMNEAALRVLRRLKFSKDSLLNRVLSTLSKDLLDCCTTKRPQRNVPTIEKFNINEEWVEAHINVLESDNGQFDGVYINLEVITDIIRTQESIQSLITEIKDEGNLARRLNSADFKGFYADLALSINGLLDVIVSPINNAISTLEHFAKGDLTQAMDGQYRGTFSDMQVAFNNTLSTLKQMVVQIKSAAGSVGNAVEEIAIGSLNLSQRSTQQSDSVQKTNTSIKSLTNTVKENAASALEVDKVANEASAIASKGFEVVKKMVHSIDNIRTSSQKVSDIIGLVDEIAFQTNLLALNAAVEAARAGDAGKGFAVVASEVRSLAGRSAEASKEIKALIEESVRHVKDGSELAATAGETLESIVQSVNHVSQLINGIANSSTKQSQGIGEVHAEIRQIDDITQQNNDIVESNNTAVQAVQDQVKILQELIRFFAIEQGQHQYLEQLDESTA